MDRLPSHSRIFHNLIEVSPSVSILSNKVATVSPIRNASGISKEILDEERAKQISWLDWIGERVSKILNPPEKIVTAEEVREREELLSRIQAMYYEKPPREPGIEQYIEAFDLLIKYDDAKGVQGLWNMAEADGIEFDDDIIDKVEDYLLEQRKRSWFE